jgi:long-chain acyl-CoA synthetase
VGINVSQVLHAWAQRSPYRVALVTDADTNTPQPLSYAALDAHALGAAQVLEKAGVVAGDAVALCCENGLGFVAAWFGALYHGCSVLPVPPMSAAPELRHRLVHAGCRALITDSVTAQLGTDASAGLDSLRRLDAEALLGGAPMHTGPRDLPAESVAMVLYTSGTTGKAKGAMITHASLLSHTAALVHHVLGLDGESVVMGALPLTHSYGIRMTLLAPFYAGARVALVRRFEAARVLACMEREGVTWFPGVPTMFHAIGHEPTANRLPRLQSALSAGAPLPREIRLRAETVLGAPLRQGFGLTEATFSTVAPADDLDGADSVGPPVFGVELRIIDADGRALSTGERGEVCVRGQNVMAGYLHDANATEAAFYNGFLRTGDVGFLDATGRLTVVDRIKDLVIRGGFNIYPAEVEAVLVEHPVVHDAVVVGMPDEHYGEEVVCVLVLEPGETLDPAALFAFCRERLSRAKLPRRYVVVDAMPVGPSGKVQRRVLRARVHTKALTPTDFPGARHGRET